MGRISPFAWISVLCLAWPARATEYVFRSQLDHFTVDVESGIALFNGQSVNSEPFAYVKPLFDSEFGDTCEKALGKADLTIVKKSGDSEIKRIVYIEKGVVSDGQNCGSVSGQGLFKLPLHRNWFSEKKRFTIGLGQGFSIIRDNRVVVEFVKAERGWKNKTSQNFINWNFFSEFTAAVTDFPVDFRVHPAAARKLTTFELKQGERIYKFVKVGDRTWAVQFPKSPWYSASSQFGIFEDMEPTRWISPFEKQLRVIKDTTASDDSRLAAVRSVAGNSSPDITYILHEVLQTDGDSPKVRHEIALNMRKSPTDKNILALVDAVRITKDTSLLNHFTKALRVRNPKGPIIEDGDDESVVKSKVQNWIQWSRSLK